MVLFEIGQDPFRIPRNPQQTPQALPQQAVPTCLVHIAFSPAIRICTRAPSAASCRGGSHGGSGSGSGSGDGSGGVVAAVEQAGPCLPCTMRLRRAILGHGRRMGVLAAKPALKNGAVSATAHTEALEPAHAPPRPACAARPAPVPRRPTLLPPLSCSPGDIATLLLPAPSPGVTPGPIIAPPTRRGATRPPPVLCRHRRSCDQCPCRHPSPPPPASPASRCSSRCLAEAAPATAAAAVAAAVAAVATPAVVRSGPVVVAAAAVAAATTPAVGWSGPVVAAAAAAAVAAAATPAVAGVEWPMCRRSAAACPLSVDGAWVSSCVSLPSSQRANRVAASQPEPRRPWPPPSRARRVGGVAAPRLNWSRRVGVKPCKPG